MYSVRCNSLLLIAIVIVIIIVSSVCAEPVIPAGSVESSWDGTNAVFKKSSATKNAVNEEGHNAVM